MSLFFLMFSCSSADAVVDNKEAMSLPEVPGVRVEVAEVQPSPATVRLSFPAVVASPNDVTLAAPRGGPVESVLVQPGDRVRRGQVLARIDAAATRQQVIIAEAQSHQASEEFERLKKLGDGVSPMQLLAAETQATVMEANAELARLAHARAVITSPVAGEVAWVGIDRGESANPGAPLLRVVSTDPVELNLSISDRDLPMLEIDSTVQFQSQALPGLMEGTLTHISPAASPDTRTFMATVTLDNPGGELKPGMLGRVAIGRMVDEEALVIPQDWVVTRLDGTGVYVDDRGVAAWRDVELGTYIEDQVVIASGLESGERVVSTGARDLAEGDPLIVVRQGICCTSGRVNWE